MKLLELCIDGFGKLVQRKFQFVSGLNLIVGPNEAGKSTLQQAILSLLYGFYEAGSVSAAKRQVLATFQPWDQKARYTGSLTFSLDNGLTFCVKRVFAPKVTTHLLSLPSGKDISSQYRGASLGRIFFADEQLGMSKEVFENTCYVRQVDLVSMQKSAVPITETLMRLSASASTDTTTSEALASLDTALREQVGTPRSRVKPLRQAQERLEKLGAERRDIMQIRLRLFTDVVELQQCEEAARAIEDKLQQLQYLQALAEREAIRSTLDKAQSAAAEVKHWAEEQSKWETWSSFPFHLKDDVSVLAAQWNDLRGELQDIQESAAINWENLRVLQEQISTLEARIAELADAEGLSEADISEVEQLKDKWGRLAETTQSAEKRWQRASEDTERAERLIEEERIALEPAIKLGLAGLADFQQSLRKARQSLREAEEKKERAEITLIKEGVNEAQCQGLESIIEDLELDNDLTSATNLPISSAPIFTNYQESRSRLHKLESKIKLSQYLQILSEIYDIRNRLKVADTTANEVRRCIEEASHWENWAAFPINLRDEIIRLEATRKQHKAECITAEAAAYQAQEKLNLIENQIDEVTRCVEALEGSRNTPVEALLDIQELATTWRMATEVYRSANERYQKAKQVFQETERQLELERSQSESAIKLGHAGIAELKERWARAKQQVSQTTNRWNIAKTEWSRVGMLETQFEELERSVQQINSGAQPAKSLRKGCIAFFLPRSKAALANQTPTEMIIYSQVKPIYTELRQAQTEVELASQNLRNIQNGIMSRLVEGHNDGQSLDDNLFAKLEQKLDSYHRLASYVDSQRENVENLQFELNQAEEQYRVAYSKLQAELARLGFQSPDLQMTLNTFIEQCDNRAQLDFEEAQLNQLYFQAQDLSRVVNTWREKETAIAALDTTLKQILAQVGIETSTCTIEIALERFNQTVANYWCYLEAKTALDVARRNEHNLLDPQSRSRLERALIDAESRIADLRAEHPEWHDKYPDKSPQEYAALLRRLNTEWSEAKNNYTHNKELLIQTIRRMQQIYDRLLEARAETEKAQLYLGKIETNITERLMPLIGKTLDDDELSILSNRLELYMQGVASSRQQRGVAEQLKMELDKARNDYLTASKELKAKLKNLQFNNDNLQYALNSFLEQCKRKAQLDSNKVELERLRLQAHALQREVEIFYEKQKKSKEVTGALSNMLSLAGIENSSYALEAALEGFNNGISNYKRWYDAKQEHDAALRHQHIIMDNQTQANNKSSLAEIELQLERLCEKHPEWSNLRPEKNAQEYGVLIQEVNREWMAKRQEYTRLKDSINQVTNSLRHPAEVDEEIAFVKAEIQRLEWFRDALELARSELEQATQEYQKQFAPKLEALMSEGLSNITNGRYSHVRVNPVDLSVALKVPEREDEVPVELLSTGTQDLVYLMLRVSIAKLLSRTEERLPLLLDDPFINFDAERQIKAFEFLSHLAQQTQIILFTKDQKIANWFASRFTSSSDHKIHNLTF